MSPVACAAILDQLLCPWCEGDASAAVPDHRLPEWGEHYAQFSADLARVMLATGNSRKEARASIDERDRTAWKAMLQRTGLEQSYRNDYRLWWADRSYALRDAMQRAANKTIWKPSWNTMRC